VRAGSSGVRKTVLALRAGVLLVGAILASCSSVPKPQEQGVLRLAGVVRTIFAADLKPQGELYEMCLASGVSQSQVAAQTVYAARTLCCSRDLQKSGMVVLQNPQQLPLRTGDFVEYQVGGARSPDQRHRQNLVSRVVATARSGDGDCWWEPRNPTLERRVAYCEWMQHEGWELDPKLPWVLDNGLSDRFWFKPAAAAAP